MVTAIVGIDVGGTKTHVKTVDLATDRVLGDSVYPSDGWRALSVGARARRLAQLYDRSSAGANVAAWAIGAHGCDTSDQCMQLQDEIGRTDTAPVRVVNDAQLLGVTAGIPGAIDVVAGTGSIAVGYRPDRSPVFAGGWGWLFGDDGGASGLVREAVRRILMAHDRGVEDQLRRHLLDAFGAADEHDLASSVIRMKPEAWSQHAATVFTAADAGSEIAQRIVSDGATALADLVTAVRDQGAVGDVVVAGGGVIVNQPTLAAAFADNITARHPRVRVNILDRPPVDGAVALARQLVRTDADTPGATVPAAL